MFLSFISFLLYDYVKFLRVKRTNFVDFSQGAPGKKFAVGVNDGAAIISV